MICWIASFPRSGNTLTRQILRDSFGKKTYTDYSCERGTEHLFPEQNDLGIIDPDKLRSLKMEKKVYFIKTHHSKFDDSPVIHIVRNGRNAVLSLAKYGDMSIIEAISMLPDQFPNWSNHYWALHNNPKALVLRFEDLLSDTDKEICRIGRFLGIKPMPFVNKFEPKNEAMGTGGKTDAQFDYDTEIFFKRCNGTVMSLLGYE